MSEEKKPQQVPSVGRHVPAIITDEDWHGGGEQSLTILPPQSAPFWEIVAYSAEPKPLTWHWPEFVPNK